ncbi:hypothetical protein L9F63_025875, partial [Diploptera punctata]
NENFLQKLSYSLKTNTMSKELKKLQKHCKNFEDIVSSPDCNAWKTVLKLKEPV